MCHYHHVAFKYSNIDSYDKVNLRQTTSVSQQTKLSKIS